MRVAPAQGIPMFVDIEDIIATIGRAAVKTGNENAAEACVAALNGDERAIRWVCTHVASFEATLLADEHEGEEPLVVFVRPMPPEIN
jgi:hypothetical protein